MIPVDFITEWAKKLAFRGGTAIHKLYLPPQARYSEDIDLTPILRPGIDYNIDEAFEAVMEKLLKRYKE